MTTITSQRQLTVNAAFLREIKEDNLVLKSMWDRLTGLVVHTATAMNHWPELIVLLGDLRDQLAVHFSLEEAYGYFDEAVDIAPQLSIRAESLRAQHAALFKEICDLSDRIVEVRHEEESVTRFLNSLTRFRHDFERHEELELKLILESLDDDLGVCD